MEKKYLFILAAVLVFFRGAILASEAPIWATFAVLLADVSCFILGYFFSKSANQIKLAAAEETQLSLNKEIASLKEALKKLKAENEEKPKATKSTKKNKE